MNVIIAHGSVGRQGLPISLTLVQYSAAAFLLIVFVLLGCSWRTSRFATDRDVPAPSIQRVVASRTLRFALRFMGFVALLLVIATAFFGAANQYQNPAPTWVFVWFWMGLVPVSIAFGPVVRRMDPAPVMSTTLRKLLNRSSKKVVEYPQSWGRWPAAIGLFAFTWFELAVPQHETPTDVGRFVLLYLVVQVIGGFVFGPVWHERAGAFSTYSEFVARVGPWMRRPDGALVVVNPLRNLAALHVGPGSVAVLIVLLGSTTFDGLMGTARWLRWTINMGSVSLLFSATAGLVVTIAFFGIAFGFIARASVGSLRPERADTARALPSLFAHSLIPISVGYFVAHYFAWIVFQGQSGFILASDPFNSGWNLFGTYGGEINYNVVSRTTILWVQGLAIVLGHAVGMVAAHERSTTLYRQRELRQAQLPFFMVMATYVVVGIGIFLGE